jgi:SH3-like domain-containing protein
LTSTRAGGNFQPDGSQSGLVVFGSVDDNLFSGRQKMDAHVNPVNNTIRPKFGQNSVIFVVLVILAASAAISLAQRAASMPEGDDRPEDANGMSVPSFPHLAEVTGNDVNIRSGPGTNYYRCGKIHMGDIVKIVTTQYGWSRIVPPVGCFSWISVQCVSRSLVDRGAGIVTGDGVQVYAGSDYVEPMHSTSPQVKLKRGDKVKLLDDKDKGGYYKIGPPTGAYVWVSAQYIRPISPVRKTPPVTVVDSNDVDPNDTVSVVPVEPSVEAAKLQEYYAVQKQIKAELAKPVTEQDYTNMKKALVEISKNKEAGKAARYAEYVVKQIENFELALAVAKQIKLQNEQLQQIKERIDKARATQLAQVEDLGRFAVIGEFQTFETYGPKHYRIVDESGNMVCYALPSGEASQLDLSKLVKQKVGLVGTIEPHPPTKKALVRFTEIVKLD